MTELILSKFNPMILEKKRLNGHAPIIVMISQRGGGKSILVVDILYHLRNIPAVICFSATESCNNYYSKYIHSLCIYDKFEPDVLNQLIITQKKKAHEYKLKGIDFKTCPHEGVGILFDDLAFTKGLLKEESMREIFFNGRHLNITTIMTFQYMMEIHPSFRTNIDYVFICKENRKDNVEKLYKYFCGMFDKSADFKKVLGQCTNDYGCMVIDNTSRSDDISQQVFWYKALLNREFKIAKDKWLLWDTKLKDDDEIDDDPVFKRSVQKSDIVVKKKGPKKIE